MSIEIDGDSGLQNITANQIIILATGLPKCAENLQELVIALDNTSLYARSWIDSSGNLCMFTSDSGYTGNIYIGGTYITKE